LELELMANTKEGDQAFKKTLLEKPVDWMERTTLVLCLSPVLLLLFVLLLVLLGGSSGGGSGAVGRGRQVINFILWMWICVKSELHAKIVLRVDHRWRADVPN
jgi:hypothetical protein